MTRAHPPFSSPAAAIQTYDRQWDKNVLLSKARAMVVATESITKASEKMMKSNTEGQAQRAQEEAAPVYLKERVRKGEALPEVDLMEHVVKKEEKKAAEEERRAVCEWVVRWATHDLYVELMEGLRQYEDGFVIIVEEV